MRSLLVHSFRSHLGGALAIGVGGGIGLAIYGVGYAIESERFAGGREGLGLSVQVAAESMRILRWPAERLDTPGGYMSYHNLTLLPLLVGIYAIVQGARAIRGAEEHGMLEMWLAAGHSRIAILTDRVLGFLAAQLVVLVGLAAGTALAMAFAGEQAVGPSFVAVGVGMLAACVFYAAALLAAQVFRTSGRAAAIVSGVMTVLYIANNLADEIAFLAPVRFASPFFYQQRSAVLVPGHTFDPVATIVLGVAAVGLVGGAAGAFQRRDCSAGLLAVRDRPRSAGSSMLGAPWLRTLASVSLKEQWQALAAWTVGAAVFLGTFAALIPAAAELWNEMPLLRELLAGAGSVEARFVSMSTELVVPVVAAFAVTQCARWMSEDASGRTELLRSAPVSPGRILAERAAVVGFGTVALVAGAQVGLFIGAQSVGVPLDGAGLGRTAFMLVLAALAVAGVGALLYAVAPHGPVVGVLVAWVAGSALLTELVPLLGWPAWIARMSVFDALGEPYLGSGEVGGVLVLAVLALGGPLVARMVAWR